MLRPDDGGLGEERVADPRLDGLDLLDGLRFGEAIQEQVDIGRRAELLVVELAKAALGARVLFRDWDQTVDDR